MNCFTAEARRKAKAVFTTEARSSRRKPSGKLWGRNGISSPRKTVGAHGKSRDLHIETFIVPLVSNLVFCLLFIDVLDKRMWCHNVYGLEPSELQ